MRQTAAVSAGILLFRRRNGELQVLLAHPGGPFWRNRDLGAWSMPKGEIQPGENAETAARREFAEEIGIPPQGVLLPLGEIRQRGGKRVEAFALEGDFVAEDARSNMFQMEWPPGSRRINSFPEVDRAAWFSMPAARQKILTAQLTLLDALRRVCADRP